VEAFAMPKMTDAGGRPHSGLQPFPVVGIVTDNVDPEELGRIQVKFPVLHEEPLSFWIRQIAPMAGIERGFYTLPEKDDEVVVMFMQGDQNTGVIMGQVWNGVDKPPAEAKDGLPGPAATNPMTLSTDTFTDGSKDLSNNDRRLWKSRAGHLFVFDDTPGAESVQIWDKSHNLAFVFDTTENRILLTNAQGDINIRCAKNLIFEAGENIKWKAGQAIEGESVLDTTHKAGQNYNVEATMDISEKASMNFTAEATMNLTAKGNIGATFEGGTTATLKGGMSTTVQSSGMTAVSGSIVTIN
jgi:uncharacterized protein involved in type VI secretion and phage assembly